MSKHLDLGCGPVPRNPYGRERVFGVDLSPTPSQAAFEVRSANLAIDPIPYDDDSFDSVSAYDFLEHIPRVLAGPEGRGTRFPFIELMNEISRVLRPGGLFYALTPCFPSPSAFVDPTHVNIMTIKTHRYFTGEQPVGRMYGFNGHFAARRVEWCVHKDSLGPTSRRTLAHHIRRVHRTLLRKFTHVSWEFESTKPVA
jgi:SAM-dependent methyltransferase